MSGADASAPFASHAIDISMYQYEVTAGLKYKFGETAAAPLK